jgi:predicted nucleic acid-binding protein
MNPWVVDASVAIKWFLPEDDTESALRLRGHDHRLHAPDFMLLETDNVLWKHIRRGLISPGESDRVRAGLRQMPIQYHTFLSLLDLAYSVALQARRSLYDSLYIALAIDLDMRLVTADRRLYQALQGTSFAQRAIWISDVP